jgi:DNA-binding transcriptional ArsR family regulator
MILPPQPVEAVVALEPVYSILVSMAALDGNDDLSGLDEWARWTAQSLPTDIRQRYDCTLGVFWLDSLTNLVPHGAATESFPAYLDAVAALDAVELRDRLLYWLIHSSHGRINAELGQPPAPTLATLLASRDAYLNYLAQLLNKKLDSTDRALDSARFSEAHALLNQPQQLQTMLVTLMRYLWEGVVAPEWDRVRPLLQESVDAFQQVNLSGMTMLEAMQAVTGRDLRPLFRLEGLLEYRRVRFIPHLHNGPYIVFFGNDQELCLTFAARRPQRTATTLSVLDQAELVNRLQALADPLRLQILSALRQAGELSTQEIMDRFRLNKSAASRHLRQLFASNLITERREEGAKKIYTLNAAMLHDVQQMLGKL